MSNKLTVWLILLLPVSMVLAATFVFYTGIGMPEETTNQGVLIQPVRPVTDLSISDDSDMPLRQDADAPTWWLFIPGGRQCDQVCQHTLYVTRQMHVALGRMAPRLKRFYVTDDVPLAPEFVDYLLAEQSQLEVVHMPAANMDKLFGGLVDADIRQSQYYFLVDPNGFMMMYYTPEISYKQFLSDVRFLIKEAGE